MNIIRWYVWLVPLLIVLINFLCNLLQPCEVVRSKLLEGHVDVDVFCRNKDTQISDNDSALSSAPPSLSSTCPSSPDVWQTVSRSSLNPWNDQPKWVMQRNRWININGLSVFRYNFSIIEQSQIDIFFKVHKGLQRNRQYAKGLRSATGWEQLFKMWIICGSWRA